jgi:hypothetical protein
MYAARGSRAGDGRGAPRLLEHCAAFERMLGPDEATARARLESVLGGELTTMLCRALTRGPRPPALLYAF